MRTADVLAVRPGEFTVSAVTCRDDHRGWSAPEPRHDVGLVLVRRGRFHRSARGDPALVDPTVAYLSRPGDEERFAHPAGGDVCTSIALAPPLWRRLAGDAPRVTRSVVYVDARADLYHRRLLAATGDADYGCAEQVSWLVLHVVGQAVSRPAPGSGARRDRAVVAAAREAIAVGDPRAAALFPLAEALGVSPYRLSRGFTRELGVSLTRYRNRVRVARVLDRLEAGETDLAAAAAEVGFADQAHMCRTVRAHVGHTPTALRRLLASAVQPPDRRLRGIG